MNQAYANTTADVDFVFWFIASISTALLLLVTGLMVYFAIRYHRSRNPKASEVAEHPLLEVAWTAIPTLIVLAMFWYGYRAFLDMRRVPPDALVVKATGQMWQWSFEYPNGKHTTEVMYVPSGKAIKVELKSLDVIHGFYVPAFRVKEDVVPGRNNYLWFKPEGFGPADIFCSQFCGLRHAYMLGRVEVMGAKDFETWYMDKSTNAPASLQPTNQTTSAMAPGHLLMAQNGCLTCHRLNETKLIGPGLGGIYGSTVTVMAYGQEKQITADDAYLERSILNPGEEVVKGYTAQMPKVASLTEADARIIVDYLKTLK
jgi:cytochrome c oxidase subunit II